MSRKSALAAGNFRHLPSLMVWLLVKHTGIAKRSEKIGVATCLPSCLCGFYYNGSLVAQLKFFCTFVVAWVSHTFCSLTFAFRIFHWLSSSLRNGTGTRHGRAGDFREKGWSIWNTWQRIWTKTGGVHSQWVFYSLLACQLLLVALPTSCQECSYPGCFNRPVEGETKSRKLTTFLCSQNGCCQSRCQGKLQVQKYHTYQITLRSFTLTRWRFNERVVLRHLQHPSRWFWARGPREAMGKLIFTLRFAWVADSGRCSR